MEHQNKWFRVFGQCARCGQKFKAKTMVYCQECKITKYCSILCMGVDKDFHKDICGNVTNMPEVTKFEQQVSTKSSNASKTKNENIEQMTKEFSTGQNDVDDETIAGTDTTEETNPETNTTEETICTFCKKIGSKLFVCSRCSNARYCDKGCQMQDFNWHKILCFSSLKNETTNVSAKLKKMSKGVSTQAPCVHCHCFKPLSTMLLCNNCGITPYCSKDCQRKDLLDHNNHCEIMSVFEKVSEFITKQFPPMRLQKYGFTHQGFIQIFLNVIFNEDTCIRPLRPALLQIIGWYPYIFPTTVVRDGVKDESHVVFHDAKTMANITIKRKDRSAEMKMSPLDECLKPGNFILLTNVLVHHSTDGTQGLHVDDLDTVHFIHLE